MLEDGINKSIESLDLDEIQTKARVIIETIILEKIQKLTDSFAMAETESLGSSDLVQVAKAAYESRVETVLIEEDRIVPGRIDSKSGKIKLGDIDSHQLPGVINIDFLQIKHYNCFKWRKYDQDNSDAL